MMYRTLYEAYEQNDIFHRGIFEVQVAEAEVGVFLRALDKELREAADTIIGKLVRAYEIQGFLFGGNVAGAKWSSAIGSAVGEKFTARAYCGSTMVPLQQIDRKTGQVVAEYKSIAEAARKTSLDESAIGKAAKGQIPSCGGFLWRKIEQ